MMSSFGKSGECVAPAKVADRDNEEIAENVWYT